MPRLLQLIPDPFRMELNLRWYPDPICADANTEAVVQMLLGKMRVGEHPFPTIIQYVEDTVSRMQRNGVLPSDVIVEGVPIKSPRPPIDMTPPFRVDLTRMAEILGVPREKFEVDPWPVDAPQDTGAFDLTIQYEYFRCDSAVVTQAPAPVSDEVINLDLEIVDLEIELNAIRSQCRQRPRIVSRGHHLEKELAQLKQRRVRLRAANK